MVVAVDHGSLCKGGCEKKQTKGISVKSSHFFFILKKKKNWGPWSCCGGPVNSPPCTMRAASQLSSASGAADDTALPNHAITASPILIVDFRGTIRRHSNAPLSSTPTPLRGSGILRGSSVGGRCEMAFKLSNAPSPSSSPSYVRGRGRGQATRGRGDGGTQRPPHDDWICISCHNNNYAFRAVCQKCSSPRSEQSLSTAFASIHIESSRAVSSADLSSPNRMKPLQDGRRGPGDSLQDKLYWLQSKVKKFVHMENQFAELVPTTAQWDINQFLYELVGNTENFSKCFEMISESGGWRLIEVLMPALKSVELLEALDTEKANRIYLQLISPLCQRAWDKYADHLKT